MPFQYACDHCEKTFQRIARTKNKRVFCSTKCYHEATKTGRMVACPNCGKKTYKNKAQLKRDRRFCSRKCYNEFRASQYVTKICPQCNKEFLAHACIAHRYNYCSWKCRAANVRYVTCERCGKVFQTSEKRYDRHHCSEECRRPPIYIQCKNCRKQFRRQPSDTDRQFCSFSCYRQYQGETLPEKAVRQTLEALGITHISEMQVGRYSIDFALPKLRIALEIDGKYWHQDEKKDAKKNKYLEVHGRYICRITDEEISNTSALDCLLLQRLEDIQQLKTVPLQPCLL